MKTDQSTRNVVFENEELCSKVIGAAIEVHKVLGPGFLESVYENAMMIEFAKQGIRADKEVSIPVFYDGFEVGKHRLDILVEDEVILELKAVKELENIFFVTVKSYMKATGKNSALLLNFSKSKLEVRRIFPNE